VSGNRGPPLGELVLRGNVRRRLWRRRGRCGSEGLGVLPLVRRRQMREQRRDRVGEGREAAAVLLGLGSLAVRAAVIEIQPQQLTEEGRPARLFLPEAILDSRALPGLPRLLEGRTELFQPAGKTGRDGGLNHPALSSLQI